MAIDYLTAAVVQGAMNTKMKADLITSAIQTRAQVEKNEELKQEMVRLRSEVKNINKKTKSNRHEPRTRADKYKRK